MSICWISLCKIWICILNMCNLQLWNVTFVTSIYLCNTNMCWQVPTFPKVLIRLCTCVTWFATLKLRSTYAKQVPPFPKVLIRLCNIVCSETTSYNNGDLPETVPLKSEYFILLLIVYIFWFALTKKLLIITNKLKSMSLWCHDLTYFIYNIRKLRHQKKIPFNDSKHRTKYFIRIKYYFNFFNLV